MSVICRDVQRHAAVSNTATAGGERVEVDISTRQSQK